MHVSIVLPSWRHQRGRVARSTQCFPPDDPRVLAARRALAVCRCADRIRAAVSGLPEDVTAEERNALAALVYGDGDLW